MSAEDAHDLLHCIAKINGLEDNFELSVDYIKYIHEYLFKDVYEFAGEFRKVDFSKHERILNNDSALMGL